MAFDAFLKIGTICGESSDQNHSQWIEILSFSCGVTQTATGSASSGGARTAERCNLQDFSVVKALDDSSPLLFKSCAAGEHISEVKLEICRATGDKAKYMEYKMADVVITSVRPGGAAQGGETLPLEEVSFNFGKITLTYSETDHQTGKSKGDKIQWVDQVKNEAG